MARTKTNQYVSTVTCLPAKSDTCNWLHMKKTGKLGKSVRFHHKKIKQCFYTGDEALFYIFMMVTHVEDFKILQIERVSQIINKVIEVTQHKPQPSVLSTL